MSRNGSGVYSLPSGNPFVTGTTISSTTVNTTLSDIATALTASIASDGQTVPTANLPMGSFKHTGTAAATALTDYARADQVQNSAFQTLTGVSGTDTITATLGSPSLTAYATGQTFRFVSAGANTTTSVTLNINAIGAKAVTKNGTTALVAGDIPSGAVVEVYYDGTRFQLVALPRALSTGAFTTVGTAATLNVGTGANNIPQYDSSGRLGIGGTPASLFDVYSPVGRTFITYNGSAQAISAVNIANNAQVDMNFLATNLTLNTPGGGLGYGNGAGGTVTQATSRTTAVTLNKPSGDITLFTAAGSATPATFRVSNTLAASTDVPTISVRSASNKYVAIVTDVIASTGFDITFWSASGTASDTPIFHFNLGKGANA